MGSFKCPACCLKKFQNKTELIDHLINLESYLVCPICKQTSCDLRNLILHLQYDCQEAKDSPNSLDETNSSFYIENATRKNHDDGNEIIPDVSTSSSSTQRKRKKVSGILANRHSINDSNEQINSNVISTQIPSCSSRHRSEMSTNNVAGHMGKASISSTETNFNNSHVSEVSNTVVQCKASNCNSQTNSSTQINERSINNYLIYVCEPSLSKDINEISNNEISIINNHTDSSIDNISEQTESEIDNDNISMQSDESSFTNDYSSSQNEILSEDEIENQVQNHSSKIYNNTLPLNHPHQGNNNIYINNLQMINNDFYTILLNNDLQNTASSTTNLPSNRSSNTLQSTPSTTSFSYSNIENNFTRNNCNRKGMTVRNNKNKKNIVSIDEYRGKINNNQANVREQQKQIQAQPSENIIDSDVRRNSNDFIEPCCKINNCEVNRNCFHEEKQRSSINYKKKLNQIVNNSTPNCNSTNNDSSDLANNVTSNLSNNSISNLPNNANFNMTNSNLANNVSSNLVNNVNSNLPNNANFNVIKNANSNLANNVFSNLVNNVNSNLPNNANLNIETNDISNIRKNYAMSPLNHNKVIPNKKKSGNGIASSKHAASNMRDITQMNSTQTPLTNLTNNNLSSNNNCNLTNKNICKTSTSTLSNSMTTSSFTFTSTHPMSSLPKVPTCSLESMSCLNLSYTHCNLNNAKSSQTKHSNIDNNKINNIQIALNKNYNIEKCNVVIEKGKNPKKIEKANVNVGKINEIHREQNGNQRYDELEERNTELLEERNTELLEERNTELLEERNIELLEERNNELLEERNTELLEERNNKLLEERNTELLEERNTELLEERNNELLEEINNELLEERNNELLEERINELLEERNNELLEERNNELLEERNELVEGNDELIEKNNELAEGRIELVEGNINNKTNTQIETASNNIEIEGVNVDTIGNEIKDINLGEKQIELLPSCPTEQKIKQANEKINNESFNVSITSTSQILNKIPNSEHAQKDYGSQVIKSNETKNILNSITDKENNIKYNILNNENAKLKNSDRTYHAHNDGPSRMNNVILNAPNISIVTTNTNVAETSLILNNDSHGTDIDASSNDKTRNNIFNNIDNTNRITNNCSPIENSNNIILNNSNFNNTNNAPSNASPNNLKNTSKTLSNAVPNNLNNTSNTLSNAASNNLNNTSNILSNAAPNNLNNTSNTLSNAASNNLNNTSNILSNAAPNNLNNTSNTLSNAAPNNLNNTSNTLSNAASNNLINTSNTMSNAALNNLNNTSNTLSNAAPNNLNNTNNTLSNALPNSICSLNNNLHKNKKSNLNQLGRKTNFDEDKFIHDKSDKTQHYSASSSSSTVRNQNGQYTIINNAIKRNFNKLNSRSQEINENKNINVKRTKTSSLKNKQNGEDNGYNIRSHGQNDARGRHDMQEIGRSNASTSYSQEYNEKANNTHSSNRNINTNSENNCKKENIKIIKIHNAIQNNEIRNQLNRSEHIERNGPSHHHTTQQDVHRTTYPHQQDHTNHNDENLERKKSFYFKQENEKQMKINLEKNNLFVKKKDLLKIKNDNEQCNIASTSGSDSIINNVRRSNSLNIKMNNNDTMLNNKNKKNVVKSNSFNYKSNLIQNFNQTNKDQSNINICLKSYPHLYLHPNTHPHSNLHPNTHKQNNLQRNASNTNISNQDIVNDMQNDFQILNISYHKTRMESDMLLNEPPPTTNIVTGDMLLNQLPSTAKNIFSGDIYENFRSEEATNDVIIFPNENFNAENKSEADADSNVNENINLDETLNNVFSGTQNHIELNPHGGQIVIHNNIETRGKKEKKCNEQRKPFQVKNEND